jgi:Na+:H+ antiporter, NhaA family
MKNHMPKSQPTGLLSSLNYFLKLEASGGILLMLAALVAVIIANTPLQPFYQYFLEEVDLNVGFSSHDGMSALAIQKPILLWINDGLMAIFFFLIGLEIKREFTEGELSSRDRALLPALAAVGGMVAPALIYYFLNSDNPELVRGWAIPAATDIAFALGILALVGSRVPVSLKILLTAVAIIDDLGAILIIALFYTETIKMVPLMFGGAALLGLIATNRMRVVITAPYILLGFILWFAVLKSGIHATLAGVVTAMFIPLRCPNDPKKSPLKHLEHGLHPWVAFMVLPIFAFSNAGVSFAGMTWADVMNPVTLGIAKGLFFGKQIGVFLILVAVIKLKLSPMPKGANWWQLYAVSLLCGVGFTMSLFIGELAFDTRDQAAAVRMGVIMGSLASAILGYLILRYGPTGSKRK